MAKSYKNKLAALRKSVGYIQHDAENTFHKYKYTSAHAVLSKLREAMDSEGLIVAETQSVVLETHDGGHMAIVQLTWTIMDTESTGTSSYQGLGQGADKGDKATMKANTAAAKYLVAGMLQISWGDDPEADTSTDVAAEKEKYTEKVSISSRWREVVIPIGKLKGQQMGDVDQDTMKSFAYWVCNDEKGKAATSRQKSFAAACAWMLEEIAEVDQSGEERF